MKSTKNKSDGIIEKTKNFFKNKKIESLTFKIPLINIAIKDKSPDKQIVPVEKRILFIDDKAHLESSMIAWLEEKGYSINPVISAKDALKKISSYKYDLIILDIMMPSVEKDDGSFTHDEDTGIYIASKLKDSINKDIPIIVLSAILESVAKEKLMNIGIFAYLEKPVDIFELIQTLDRALSSNG